MQRGGDGGGDVAIGDEAQGGAGGADFLDEFGVAGPIHRADDDLADAFAEGEGDDVEDVGERGVEVEGGDAAQLYLFDDAWAVGEFFRVEGRQAHHRARGAGRGKGRGHHGDGVGHAFGEIGGAVDGIDGDVDVPTAGRPGAEFVADEDARGVVLDAFADHALAADVHVFEHAEDGAAGGIVGGFFGVATEPREAGEGGVLGGADEFKLQGTLGVALKVADGGEVGGGHRHRGVVGVVDTLDEAGLGPKRKPSAGAEYKRRRFTISSP